MMKIPPANTPAVSLFNSSDTVQNYEILGPTAEQLIARKRELVMREETEAFAEQVRTCMSYKELFELIISLEKALPEGALVDFDSNSLPSGFDSLLFVFQCSLILSNFNNRPSCDDCRRCGCPSLCS